MGHVVRLKSQIDRFDLTGENGSSAAKDPNFALDLKLTIMQVVLSLKVDKDLFFGILRTLDKLHTPLLGHLDHVSYVLILLESLCELVSVLVQTVLSLG